MEREGGGSAIRVRVVEVESEVAHGDFRRWLKVPERAGPTFANDEP